MSRGDPPSQAGALSRPLGGQTWSQTQKMLRRFLPGLKRMVLPGGMRTS
jgi:hypothetical protein